MPFFDSITLLPEDSILGIQIAYGADPRVNKVNLGIGSYKDSEGKPLVFNAVRKAEQILLSQNLNKEYSPIQGDPEFLYEAAKLIFGENCASLTNGKIFCAQAIGGTGALRLGGEFLAQTSKTLYISDHNWPNHQTIFSRGGMKCLFYPYYDAKIHKINFDGMCQAITKMVPGSVILLHACCHNPTGLDPSFEQWKQLSQLLQKHEVIPFFDFAYQGLAENLEGDARPVRYFLEQGHEMIISSSYSKNFGLYGERLGMISIVTPHKEIAQRVGSHVKQIIRGNYSTPPIHPQRIVKTILQSPELKAEWIEELNNMRGRINAMREALVAGLFAKGSDKDWSFLSPQRGIFSYCGLTPDQVQKLIKDYGIYMPLNGRINVAGLNWHNLDYVIEAIIAVIRP